MAQLFDIRKVVIGPKSFVSEVELAPSAPLLTSDDEEGTRLVLALMPELADHVCLGDSAPSFGDVVGSTELAHLLEHVTVELLARTDAAGDVTCGQTVETGERSYQITLACPDDVLVAGALSSAVWILQWAYSGGGEPLPDVEAIVSGLVALVDSLGEPAAEEAAADEPDDGAPAEGADSLDEGAEAPAPPEPYAEEPDDLEDEAVSSPDATTAMTIDPSPSEPRPEDGADAGAQDVPGLAEEGDPEGLAESPADAGEAPSPGPWDMGNYPRPHLVR